MAIGYLLAILTGIFYGLQGVVGKWVVRQASPLISAWAVTVFPLPFLLVLLSYQGIPPVNAAPFWMATGTSFFINLIAWQLFFRSLECSTLAQTMPYTALTPLFIIPVSYVLLGEWPSSLGFGGIVLIIIGAFGLQIPPGQWRLSRTHLFTDPGTRLMILVAFLWSISATVEKIAVVNSSPLFYAVVINGLLGLAFSGLIALNQKHQFASSLQWKGFTLLGLVSAAMVVVQFYALKYLYVSYVIAFKRAGVLVSVLLGHFLFHEKGIVRHLLFTALMLLGAFLILTKG